MKEDKLKAMPTEELKKQAKLMGGILGGYIGLTICLIGAIIFLYLKDLEFSYLLIVSFGVLLFFPTILQRLNAVKAELNRRNN